VSWATVHGLARRLAAKIADSGYRPDLIVAIGRGGYVPGRLLSDWLGIMDLTSFKIEHYRHAEKQRAAQVRYPLPADRIDPETNRFVTGGLMYRAWVNALIQRAFPVLMITAE